MAYADPLDPEADRRRGLGIMPAQAGAIAAPVAGRSGGAAGGVADRTPGAGSGTGFINLQSYLGLNRGEGERMANQAAGNVAQQAQQAQADMQALQGQAFRSSAPSLQAVNPELYGRAGQEASTAAANARALGNGGIGAVLGQQYGQQGGYGSGQRGFDAFLAGAAGGDTLARASRDYGGLDKALGLSSADYRPSAPGSQPFDQGKGLGVGLGGTVNYAPPPVASGPQPSGGGGGGPFDDVRRRRRMF